ncbi:aliphatic sulfonate ABC transporter substrate-binding protein [Priestia sp. JNUCC 25]
MIPKKRFYATTIILLLLLALTGCGGGKETTAGNQSVEGKGVVKVGYQKSAPMLLLKKKQLLEKNLGKLGYKVKWYEFNTGIAVAEALNAGSIDIGSLGDSPSLFGKARGLDFVYIASEPSVPESEGILVKKDSSIKTIKDLKGKKIAFNKASISQYLLLKTLKSEGMTESDIKPVYLNPPEASVAFSQGQVDAWVIWEPYFTTTANKGNRVLSDATGLVSFRSFYVAGEDFVKDNPKATKRIVLELQKVGKEINKNPKEAAELVSDATKIPVDTWKEILKKKPADVQFMNQKAADDLQDQANDLLEMKLITKQIDVQNSYWAP